MLKRLFCSHLWKKSGCSIVSKRVANDNYVIETYEYTCKKCGKNNAVETLKEIEKDWYFNNQ